MAAQLRKDKKEVRVPCSLVCAYTLLSGERLLQQRSFTVGAPTRQPRIVQRAVSDPADVCVFVAVSMAACKGPPHRAPEAQGEQPWCCTAVPKEGRGPTRHSRRQYRKWRRRPCAAIVGVSVGGGESRVSCRMMLALAETVRADDLPHILSTTRVEGTGVKSI